MLSKSKAPQSLAGKSANQKTLNFETTLTLLNEQYKSQVSQLKQAQTYLDSEVVYISIDGEWHGVGSWAKGFKAWLQSTALVYYFSDGGWQIQTFLFTSSRVSLESRQVIEALVLASDIPTSVFTVDEPEQASIVESFLQELELKPKVVEVLGKYSPLDYHAYFGEVLWLEMVNSGLVEQKRCLRFNNKAGHKGKRVFSPTTLKYSYRLRDLQGLNSRNLKAQAESVGVKLFAKDTIGDYITKMALGYEEVPLEATTYNICDTFANMQILLAYPPLINEIIDSLQLPECCYFTLDNLPHTTGSLVGRVFTSFLEYYPLVAAKREGFTVTDDDLLGWRLALRKHSRKSQSLNSFYNRQADAILKGQRECKTVEDYKNYTINIGTAKKPKEKNLAEVLLDDRITRQLFESNLYEQACARVFGSNVETTSVFAAQVQGGRCNNSNPFSTYAERILDVDLSSCYGSTLRKLNFPIGLPTIYSTSLSHGQEIKTFDEVYKQLRGELVPDLYFADVSTTTALTFSQDLVFSSRGMTAEVIRKAVTGVDHYEDEEGFSGETVEDIKKIPNDFTLARNTIEHGKLCHSSVNAIERVATERELGEFRGKVQCNTLVYYPQSKKFENIQEFITSILADGGDVATDKQNNVIDTRSRIWLPVKLEYFTGVFVDKRKSVKRQMSKFGKNTSDFKTLYAKQEMYKLFVNTLYGVLASVYFSFGNTVLANVITDKARVGAWMLSKSLRTFQEITDGGEYRALSVAFNLGTTKPGLDVLSDWRKWEAKRKVHTKDESGKPKISTERVLAPLGGYTAEYWEWWFKNYDKMVREGDNRKFWNDQIDKLATDHIKSFWSVYGLEFEFFIEHKYEHTSWSIGYLGKSDYCLNTLGSEPDVIKKRGARQTDRVGYQNPCIDLLQLLSRGKAPTQALPGYKSDNLCKVGEYQKANTEGLEVAPEQAHTIAELKATGQLVPGWNYEVEHQSPQINNGHIYINDGDMADSIKKRKGFSKGERLQFFERYVTEPQRMVEAMTTNTLSLQAARRKAKTKVKQGA